MDNLLLQMLAYFTLNFEKKWKYNYHEILFVLLQQTHLKFIDVIFAQTD